MKINVKLPLLIAVSAMIAGIIISAWSYSRIQQQTEERSLQTLMSLAETVYNTAAAAAYLDDAPLAKDVTDGLLKNTIVACAEITTTKIDAHAEQHCEHQASITKPLFSPFEQNQQVGTLLIYESKSEIQAQVLSQFYSASINVFAIVCIITLLTLVVTYLLVSHPISVLSDALKDIDFANDSPERLDHADRQDEIGSIRHIINKLLDKLDERLQHERNLVLQTENLASNFKMICELSTSALVVTDETLTLKSVNPKFIELWTHNTGLAEVTFDDHWLERLSFEMAELKSRIKSTPADSEPHSIEVEVPAASELKQDAIWFEVTFTKAENRLGELNIFIIINDITEQKRKLIKTEFAADHDTLTKLKNRRATRRIVERLIEQSEPATQFSVLLIDLDGFKQVNDSLGHDAGDIVLKEIAKRYQDIVRKTDIICRWGGDEFVVVLSEVDEKETANIAEKILSATQLPVQIDQEQQAKIGASVGVASYPKDSQDFDKLFDQADHAMYQIKKSGKNNILFYSQLS
ncbi:GGDEF domain-containing protein [Gayadomonas joobiniege]|uniref:sensor domain-containing diguanylate cyclase n=1 Tax=Gayadomonas joobiniege TaxID=1234606 RepID=UPI00035E97EB|nr:GGDEF domain-containing protein [Gayadomonas joobiniege]